MSDASDIVPSKEEEKRRIFEINTVFNRKQKDRQFVTNKISTAKYNCVTFLPLNLFEQFTKMANFYFLVLTCVKYIKPISRSGVASMVMSLSFVVGIFMIKDIFEDR
jgi:phospholipid-transporting ATPase